MVREQTSMVRQALAYMFLPRLFVRLRAFFPDLVLFAGLMAQIFSNVGLLPKGHPFLMSSNEGKFGIREVMAAAAQNLKGGWRHSDQYIVYASFVLGMVLLSLQFVVLFVMLVSESAQAAIPFVGMFITINPTNDIAFLMLDRVFQIPGFFGSSLDPDVVGSISPFARGMQELFRFYSGGMLVIAFFIVLYYFFALAMETMQTGQPFGKRFPTVYGPIRLVLAVLLLLPLAYGYNTGQYLTLMMARWGSSFATNSWLSFNNYMATMVSPAGSNPMGLSGEELIASPRVPQINSLVNFFYLVHTCKEGYKIAYGAEIDPIEPYFVVAASSVTAPSATLMASSTSFSSVKDLFHGGDVVITFGAKNDKYKRYAANVKPYCGTLTIPVQSQDVEFVEDIYDAYFNYIKALWFDSDLQAYGRNMAYIVRFKDKAPKGYSYPAPSVSWDAPLSATDARPAGKGFYITMRINKQAGFNGDIESAIDAMRSGSIDRMQMDSDVLSLGWGGAALWYSRIAEFNGAAADAVITVPAPTDYPMIMKHVAGVKKTLENHRNPKERFSLSTSSGENISLEKYWSGSDLDNPALDAQLAYLFDDVFQTVADDQLTARPTTAPGSNNPIMTMFRFIYEETGLMSVRENNQVYPLAKLSMLGKTIIDKTIFSLGVGTLMSGFGGLLSGAGVAELGAAFEQGGGVLLGFATTGLIMGFVLYYLIPFFPFLYFFLAVGSWVKSIFEAMVAVPLWALAHLRLDGEGVGNAASKGYFLLFEIFLRPIFVVFGLLASVSIFSALVTVLDSIFDLVVWNVAGFDMSILSSISAVPAGDLFQSFMGGVDALFYTIFYTILVYMLATASFKLIDLIPNKMLRFLQPVPTFHDDAGDPAENLVRNVAIGGHVLTGHIGQGLGDFSKGTGQTVGKLYSRATGDKLGGPGG